MDVRVTDHPTGDCRVVVLSGQLDMDTALQLEKALAEARTTNPRVVVDLGDLTFCDSIGLSTLVVAERACGAAGGYLRLARPTPFMQKLLAVVGVDDTVPVYDSVDAAQVGVR
jgi:anti-sigma B factor antagonist